MSRPAIFSRMNGKARPAKFEPPPTQPITTAGNAPASSICASASWPMTVWCRSTWLRTLPSEYAVSSRPAASSTASEMAMPRLPGESGCSASTFRPASVSLEGLLLVRGLDQVHLALEPDELAREGERAAPLAGAGLGREARTALGLVVV